MRCIIPIEIEYYYERTISYKSMLERNAKKQKYEGILIAQFVYWENPNQNEKCVKK